MTQIHYGKIEEKAAWRGQGLTKAAFTRSLGAAERLAAEGAMRRLRGREVESLVAADFADPALAGLAAEIAGEMRDGRGVLVVTGFDASAVSHEDLTRIYWGLGTLMGMPQTQSIFGDRLGHVRREVDNPTARGYRSDRELRMHTDTTDIAGLLCLQPARAGGVTQIVSALAVHNEIAATRPDLLPALYEGYFWHLGAEQNPGDPDITRERIPVFAVADGKVCCRYLRVLLDLAGSQTGGTPAALTEALDYLDEVAHREDMMVQFTLEPGEMMFLNNFTVLHARTAFEEFPEPARRRHLVRLWLEVPGLRPYPPAMDPYRGGGIKPQAEKLRALAGSPRQA